MDKPKVFIDGREGTTGLQLWERLSRRTDLELLRIGEARRKDPAERKKYLNAADLVFLCLPDAAAWEAVGLIENGHTRIIDASTAHRTASGWVYGFPELYKDPERIIGQARRVANPGCHATGFLASAAPLSALHILLRAASSSKSRPMPPRQTATAPTAEEKEMSTYSGRKGALE